MYKARSFREKLRDDKGLPRVQPLTGGMKKRLGPGTIVLPSGSEVESLIRRIPRGKIITINGLREVLARHHKATTACPIVTGIYARIVAGAAGEEGSEGKKRIAPYWRTLKTGGELNEKYPGGIPNQRRRLTKEGLRVVTRGKRTFVRDYERYQARIK